MRDSALIYRSFYDAIKELEPLLQAQLWNAIIEYALDKKQPELTGICKTVFTLIKPQLDANLKRFESGKLPKKKRNGSKTEAKDKQTISETEANNNNNNNNNDNNNDNNNLNKNNNKNKNKGAIPNPLLHEVKIFFKENGYTEASAVTAWKYYEDGNWHDSKGNKVKNWKQKMRSVWFKDENKDSNKRPMLESEKNPELAKW